MRNRQIYSVKERLLSERTKLAAKKIKLQTKQKTIIEEMANADLDTILTLQREYSCIQHQLDFLENYQQNNMPKKKHISELRSINKIGSPNKFIFNYQS